MKKFRTILSVMILSLSGLMFSGCDDDDFFEDWGDRYEDQNEADVLHGTWEGYLGTFYNDRWGVTGDDYVTTIRFDAGSYGSTSGRGYELDRLAHDPYGNYYYSEFRWSIVDGVITIIYEDNIYSPVYIYDYRLTDNSFSGYMDDGTNREIRFNFRYVSHFDWDRFFRSGRSDAKVNAMQPEKK